MSEKTIGHGGLALLTAGLVQTGVNDPFVAIAVGLLLIIASDIVDSLSD